MSETILRRVLFGTLLLLVVPPTAWAQTSSVDVGGQIRQRSEVDARDFDSDTSPADVHLLRTRLNAAVDPVDRVHAFVQLQDSRRFGAGNPNLGRGTMDPSAGQLDLHQAYFEVTGLMNSPISLKVGRQELIYGNQRLIGAVGWSNVGRTFDAGVMAYDGTRASVDLFAARLVGSPAEDEGSENLFGLYSTWRLDESHTLDAHAILDNNTNDVPDQRGVPVDRLVRFTPGVALKGSLLSLSYELEAAYQTGKKALSPGQARSTIRASLLSASLRYDLGPSPDVTLGTGYTRLSGDDTPGDNELSQFNTLFATNHKFYGFMDYFPGRGAPFGLQDVHAQTSIRVSNQVNLAAKAHHFVQAESTPNRALQTLGDELDLTVTYEFAEPVSFRAGLSAFLPGEAMEADIGNDDPAYWGYLMSTINL